MIQETFWVRGEPRTKIQLDKLLTVHDIDSAFTHASLSYRNTASR